MEGNENAADAREVAAWSRRTVRPPTLGRAVLGDKTNSVVYRGGVGAGITMLQVSMASWKANT